MALEKVRAIPKIALPLQGGSLISREVPPELPSGMLHCTDGEAEQ